MNKDDDDLVFDYERGVYVPRFDRVAAEAAKMPNSVRKIFDEHCKNVVFNDRLHARITHYAQAIFSRDGNVEWFGSPLLGVHQIRFFDSDRDELFDNILEVDEDFLTEVLSDKRYSDMVMEWNVTGDVWNLMCVYLLHRYIPIMDKNAKAKEAIVNLIKLLQFKFFSSIYVHFFPRPVDLPAAEATYAALSMKFYIKQEGSWGALIQNQAEYFVNPNPVHYDDIKRFTDTEKIIYFISDLNTRTKQTVKDYYGVLDRVRRDNSRMLTQSSSVEIDGETILRDRITVENTARQNLLEASTSLSSMYKEELARVACELVPKGSPNALKTLMVYITSLPMGKERDAMESIMTDTLSHAFEYIVTNRIKFTDVTFILKKIRALYMASKTSDPVILSLRKRMEDVARKQTHLRHDAALAAIRNMTLLYFVLRAMASVNR